MLEDKRPVGYSVSDNGKVRILYSDGSSKLSRTGIPHIPGIPDLLSSQQPETHRRTTHRRPSH